MLVRFALDSPAISTVILGATSAEQVRALARATDGNPLTRDERRIIKESAPSFSL
jgi:aryl-alcohol dehydrogenase-like predicted oxidoreductase